jgi:hypothetical protein
MRPLSAANSSLSAPVMPSATPAANDRSDRLPVDPSSCSRLCAPSYGAQFADNFGDDGVARLHGGPTVSPFR